MSNLSRFKKVYGIIGLRGVLKSLWFNLRYIPMPLALKFPVILSSDVEVRNCHRGAIIFTGGVVIGCLSIGLLDLEYTFRKKSLLNLKGTVIVNGNGFHYFAPGTILYVEEGATAEFGNNFSCSHDCKFYIRKGLRIGDDNMWSYYNVVMDNDGHQIFNDDNELINPNKEIVFGNKVWMGSRCTVLKGITIPDNTVIATNSVMTKSPDRPGCVVASSRILKETVHWERTLV